MEAPNTTPVPASDINQLQTGSTYRVTTARGRAVVGEYLGVETPYGDWSILIRHQGGTESIAVIALDSIELHAA